MILYQGSLTPVDRKFDEDETAISVVARDFNGLTVPTTQPTNLGDGTWRTNLSIPATAPVCHADSGYYQLIWTHSGGTVENDFQVVAYEEGLQRPPPAGFGISGVSLIDEVFLPLGTTDITCDIVQVTQAADVILASNTGDITFNSVATPSMDSPGSLKASIEWQSPAIAPGEYVAHWRYKVGNNVSHEFRQAFVISMPTASVISSLRQYIDQSGMIRFLGHLQFSDVELVDCLYRACDRINAHPPQVTNYAPDTVPYGMAYAMRAAALHEMLNRLYLAEGLSTFNFQGGSVTVDVDRTAFIQTKMDEMNNWLETNLTNVKSVNVAGRSIGVLHLSVSQGGLNNNYKAMGRLLNPGAFNLARQMGFNFA